MTANTLEQRARELLAAVDMRSVDREVMADVDRPCLFGVRGPCQHPRCLEVHAVNVAVLRAIEAALRLSAGADWQPIETAPKGGEVDVWNGKRYADAAWAYPSYGRNGEACWCEQQYQHGYGWELSRIEPQPTHWQPRPAAPRHEPVGVADLVLVSKSEFQRALEGIHVPKMSPVKQECFKAGTRAVILAFNGVFDAPRHEPDDALRGDKT